MVLDNLSCLASGLDENKGQDHEAISNWLLNLRRRKITVIFIHHAGRGGEMRGHSKREDACSWILQLRDAKEEGDDGAKFISHFAKPSRNTSKALPDLLWHFQRSPAPWQKWRTTSVSSNMCKTEWIAPRTLPNSWTNPREPSPSGRKRQSIVVALSARETHSNPAPSELVSGFPTIGWKLGNSLTDAETQRKPPWKLPRELWKPPGN